MKSKEQTRSQKNFVGKEKASPGPEKKKKKWLDKGSARRQEKESEIRGLHLRLEGARGKLTVYLKNYAQPMNELGGEMNGVAAHRDGKAYSGYLYGHRLKSSCSA